MFGNIRNKSVKNLEKKDILNQVLVFVLCHSLKASLNIYEAYMVIFSQQDIFRSNANKYQELWFSMSQSVQLFLLNHMKN